MYDPYDVIYTRKRDIPYLKDLDKPTDPLTPIKIFHYPKNILLGNDDVVRVIWNRIAWYEKIGYKPRLIIISDDVMDAILKSQYYNHSYITTPSIGGINSKIIYGEKGILEFIFDRKTEKEMLAILNDAVEYTANINKLNKEIQEHKDRFLEMWNEREWYRSEVERLKDVIKELSQNKVLRWFKSLFKRSKNG